jgi:ankyrin repeat protein
MFAAHQIASKNGHIEVVKVLSHIPRNESPLMTAAWNGEISKVKSLIENGTNINLTDKVSKNFLN